MCDIIRYKKKKKEKEKILTVLSCISQYNNEHKLREALTSVSTLAVI